MEAHGKTIGESGGGCSCGHPHFFTNVIQDPQITYLSLATFDSTSTQDATRHVTLSHVMGVAESHRRIIDVLVQVLLRRPSELRPPPLYLEGPEGHPEGARLTSSPSAVAIREIAFDLARDLARRDEYT